MSASRSQRFKIQIAAGLMALAHFVSVTSASAAVRCEYVNELGAIERAAAEKIKQDFPAIFAGIARAIGEEEALLLVKDWQGADLQVMETAFDDFHRHIIEDLRDPHQNKQLPRQYVLQTFGNLGEVIALSEFRKAQPPGAEIIGDIGHGGGSEAGLLRRPDGLSFNVDAVTGQLRIHALLESKISKTSGWGFKLDQYQEMLEQWQSRGLQVRGRRFEPEQVKIVTSEGVVPLRAVTLDGFLNLIYLYQPSAHHLSLEARAQAGIRHLMPVSLDPWTMRFIGISIAAEKMVPYLRDGFPGYLKDMRELIALYSTLAPLKTAANSVQWRDQILPILQRYDVEYLNAAIATFAPDILPQVKSDRTIYVGGSIETAPPKSTQAAVADYNQWRAGRLQIDDPVELVQLRLRYDAVNVCTEFLFETGRWPQRMRSSPQGLTGERAARFIREDRLASIVAKMGGETTYFLMMLPPKVAKKFILQSGWRPEKEDVARSLSRDGLKPTVRAALEEKVRQAFGPKGWALRVGEAPWTI